jgi:hypothetical protein
MKKMITIFLFLNIIVANQYCESINLKKLLNNGDITWIEKITFNDIDFFLTLNQDELKLLKNLLYAKKGYIFESQELSNYFKKYKWYKPTKKNVENEFTFNEKIILSFICEIERRMYFNNLSFKDFEKILISDWIENFEAPGAILYEYRFSTNYSFKYISQYGTCYIEGEWRIENHNIFIKPKLIKYWEKEFILHKEGLSIPQPDRENNKVIRKKITESTWYKIGSFDTLQFPYKEENIFEEVITPVSLHFSQIEIINNKMRILANIPMFRGDYSQLFEID